MAKTQSTEYILVEEDGGSRNFDSRKEAREFIEKDSTRLKEQVVEKRVWDHTECGEQHHWCEIDEQKTEIISVEEFMSPRR